MRDGVTPDERPGQLYDSERDIADGGDFLDRQTDDTYQFRIIVAPEDAGRMEDLKPFVDPQLETKLRSMGERGDIIVTMTKVMRAHGIERPAGDFAIFNGARKSEPVIGMRGRRCCCQRHFGGH